MGIKALATGDLAEVLVDAGSDVASRPTRAAVIRKFMSLQGKTEIPLSVIRSNCLQVKEKGVIVRPSG
jgi:hypothetical protein